MSTNNIWLPNNIESLCLDLARCERYHYRNRMVNLYRERLMKELESAIEQLVVEHEAMTQEQMNKLVHDRIRELADSLERGVFDLPIVD